MLRLPVLALLLCVWLAPPASAAVDAGAIDALVDRSLDGLMVRHLSTGAFDDPLSGPRFNYGAIGIAWLAGERAPAGDLGDARRAAAAVTLRTATRNAAPGAFQIWLEALAVRNNEWLDADTRGALAAHLQRFVAPAVGVRARPCQVKPRCYNNLKLVDAVATLQLVRTGLSSPVAGTRLADPARFEEAARAFLAERVPAVVHPNLRLSSGALDVTDAAVLSDPSKNPLAYHTLSAALLVRAVRVLGVEAAPSTRLAARRALWALVALADPLGTVAWMGRGQDHTWTYAASTYAAIAGAAEFARETALAARLRRLAELTFAELLTRVGPAGLAVGRGAARSTLVGLDRSQDTIVCNGLALTFLHLASAEAGAAEGLTAPLPAEVAGSSALDPSAAGVATIRGARTWLAVHRAATHPRDARYDAGLLAAQVLVGDRWRAVVGQRPNTDAIARAPAAGPLLVRGPAVLVPGGRLTVAGNAIVLRGVWRSARRRVAATWRFEAIWKGVVLRTPCPRGYSVRLVEWVPGDAAVRELARGAALPDRTVVFSTAARVRLLIGRQSSATYEDLVGVELEAPCRGRTISIAWRTSG